MNEITRKLLGKGHRMTIPRDVADAIQEKYSEAIGADDISIIIITLLRQLLRYEINFTLKK